MYIVKLSSKDQNDDVQLFEFEIKLDNEDDSIGTAINYYYETYWTNTEWKKEEYEKEMESFINKIDLLSTELLLKRIPNKNTMIFEYEHELRIKLDSTYKSISEFNEMDIVSKILYLNDIGCELNYFSYLKEDENKFEKITL